MNYNIRWDGTGIGIEAATRGGYVITPSQPPSQEPGRVPEFEQLSLDALDAFDS